MLRFFLNVRLLIFTGNRKLPWYVYTTYITHFDVWPIAKYLLSWSHRIHHTELHIGIEKFQYKQVRVICLGLGCKFCKTFISYMEYNISSNGAMWGEIRHLHFWRWWSGSVNTVRNIGRANRNDFWEISALIYVS